MAKTTKKKKKSSVYDDMGSVPSHGDPVPDDAEPVVIVDDAPTVRVGNRAAVGQRFWLVPKGHRKPAREVMVASMSGDAVSIRCLDNGEMKVLPNSAFGSSVLRA